MYNTFFRNVFDVCPIIELGVYICACITDIQVDVLDFMCLFKVCDPGMIVVSQWSLSLLSNFDI